MTLAAVSSSTAPLLEARDLSRHYNVSRGMFKPHATVKALNTIR